MGAWAKDPVPGAAAGALELGPGCWNLAWGDFYTLMLYYYMILFYVLSTLDYYFLPWNIIFHRGQLVSIYQLTR